jgi:hypothetical protein
MVLGTFGNIDVVAVIDKIVESSAEYLNRRKLRNWWHATLKDRGRYSCYGIFLALPSDKEAIMYLSQYGEELDLISGKSCLIIALSRRDYRLKGFKGETWRKILNKYAGEGLSIKVAQLFDIAFTEFPCLLLFEDIRSPKHVAIRLAGMPTSEIAIRMRKIFSVIQRAVNEEKPPLAELKKVRKIETIQKTGRVLANKAGKLTEKTFEKAMEAWIQAIIK